MPKSLRTEEEIRQIIRRYFPKIADGTVEVVSLTRSAGIRCLLVVRSSDPKVSAVPACSLERGEKLTALIAELDGELPTIVQRHAASEELIRACFAPDAIVFDPENRKAIITIHPTRQKVVMVRGEDQIIRASSELTGLLSEVTGWEIRLAGLALPE